jgi:hypothetical protein
MCMTGVRDTVRAEIPIENSKVQDLEAVIGHPHHCPREPLHVPHGRSLGELRFTLVGDNGLFRNSKPRYYVLM